MHSIQNNDNKKDNYSKGFLLEDWFFVYGIILTIMTRLRPVNVPVGPGEICLIIWCILKIRRPHVTRETHSSRVLTLWYWMAMLFSLLIGTLVNLAFFNYSNSIHNILAYFYCFLLCFFMEHWLDKCESVAIITRLANVSAVIFLLIYMLGSSGTLRDFAFYGSRFCGGALNPNQLGLLFVPLPFLCFEFLRLNVKNNRKIASVVSAFTILTSIFIGLKTNSDALIGSWFLASLTLFYFSTYSSFFTKKSGQMIRIVGFLFLSLILILYYDYIADKIFVFFNTLDADGSRAFLWKSGLGVVTDSGFLGLGPGTFAGFQHQTEAHNIIIDFMMQGGLFFIIYFVGMLFFILKRLRNKLFIFGACLALLLFTMGHFVGRQPFFYVMLFFFIVYAEKNEMVS